MISANSQFILFWSVTEKSPPNSSQLKESMDLYEEIVTEEQQSKESSYTEVSCCAHLSSENTGLNTENCRLKKNISALLRTARQEVTRKDAEIQRLNQWYGFISAGDLLEFCVLHVLYNYVRWFSNVIISCSSTQQGDSDKHKSKHRDEKYQSHKLSDSTDRRPRSGSYPHKDCHDSEKNRSHKSDKDRGRKYDSRSGKCKTHLNAEVHHRSDRTKSPPPEISISTISSDDTKGKRTQDKAKLATPDSEQTFSRCSKEVYSQDHRRIRNSDRYSRRSDSKDRKKSSSSQRTERHADREGERLLKDHQRKEERQWEDESSRKHKKSMSRECEKQKLKESNQGKVDVRSKERQEKTHGTLKRSPKGLQIAEKNSVEENSSNRKLSFMETLNLTLSPIKKPTLPFDATQDNLLVTSEAVKNRPMVESAQSLCLEDMCVVDEIESSELESGCKDAAKQSLESCKYPNSERIDKQCDDAKDTQEEDKKSLRKAAPCKLLKDSAIGTTVTHNQLLETAENQMTSQHSPKSPDSGSLKAAEGDSDSKGDTSAPPQRAINLNGISKQLTREPIQKLNQGKDTERTADIVKPFVLESKGENQTPALQKSFPEASLEETATTLPSGENNVSENVPKGHQISPAVSLRDCQKGQNAPASFSHIHKKDDFQKRDSPKDTDAVSSTISLESLPQEGLSLPEAIYVLTQTNEEVNDDSSIITAELSSCTSCIGVSKVSSTTEEAVLPENPSNLLFTPRKTSSPGTSDENNIEPSSSVPLLHDEDSMMRTLNNLRRIPDVISPLRSPVRIAKKSHVHVHNKPGHVKSLQKGNVPVYINFFLLSFYCADFSSTAVDVNSKKLDVNKENKYPGSPVNHDTQNMTGKVSDLCPRLSDAELEEGEILSESDEAAVGDSPTPANKRAKIERPVRNKPSPKSVLKRKAEDTCVASKESADSPGGSTRSPKSRFKTVCPAATKASFSNIEEIMETFKLVRTEIRKKYMKLHKTFPRKSFYGMMENFQESFLEFVDGAHFGKICSQAEELKLKLKKLIASVFRKVSNNGIVKRIFEQQAVDLKQKLWDFVDVQVDYLFKDIHSTLKSLCNPEKTQAEDKKPSGNEKASRQPSVKNPQFQQKEAQSSPTSLNHGKPCALVPYKTGLGSRGKDIRIAHTEKGPHSTDCQNPSQTGINFLPPKNISTPEKNNIASLVVSQSGSLLDKPDFQILTEQQASNLTFSLVRDSQMGEIFRCLLQGSDLLENGGMVGDSTTWSLSTPRKDGERLISITTPPKFSSPSKLISPTKFNTPSKVFATWASISPRKMSSPQSKDPVQLNPALFDESCLLEVPDNRTSSFAAQRSYSILTEDLAVSLTIPSPLKSDSHLSFLQPSSMSSMHIMSTPDSVISAHISEDALLDGEDATEQDIHLALDTDNSSCGTTSSMGSSPLATSFTLKPDMAMQALVMEKSNDHFIVKIRQTTASANSTLKADSILSETLTENQQNEAEDPLTSISQAKAALSEEQQSRNTPSFAVSPETGLSNFVERSGICQTATGSERFTLTADPLHKKDSESQNMSVPVIPPSENSLHSGAQRSDHLVVKTTGEDVIINESPSQTLHEEGDAHTQTNPSVVLVFESQKMISPITTVASNNSPHQRSQASPSDSDRSFTIAEDTSSTPDKDQRDSDKSRKRKKHQDKLKAKRYKKEVTESTEEKTSPSKTNDDSKSSPAPLSPNSLSAKNVVRKKGEVVMAWTRSVTDSVLYFQTEP
uniref:Caspase 8 associated protein 2 n=1 Tax=Echeneis naucrates TaxID=173247 RepID=A0A665VA51_ECHNA